jgi:hypothetical protein
MYANVELTPSYYCHIVHYYLLVQNLGSQQPDSRVIA